MRGSGPGRRRRSVAALRTGPAAKVPRCPPPPYHPSEDGSRGGSRSRPRSRSRTRISISISDLDLDLGSRTSSAIRGWMSRTIWISRRIRISRRTIWISRKILISDLGDTLRGDASSMRWDEPSTRWRLTQLPVLHPSPRPLTPPPPTGCRRRRRRRRRRRERRRRR